MASAPFFSRLQARVDAVDSLLCVGLDPHPEDLEHQTAEAAEAFCHRLIDATHEYACMFKPNAAFFEALGADGFAALQKVIAYAKATGALVLLDAKRGDIGSTSAAYARASFGWLGADAVTLAPYMGRDSVAPFLQWGGKGERGGGGGEKGEKGEKGGGGGEKVGFGENERGVFVLCRTSNPSARDVEELRVVVEGQERRVFEAVAAGTAEWGGEGQVGLVVGATCPGALADIRKLRPHVWILAPGVGAQGGSLEDALEQGIDAATGAGLVLPVSRGISRAADARVAARDMALVTRAARHRVREAAAAATTPATAAVIPPTRFPTPSHPLPPPSTASPAVSASDRFLRAAMGAEALRFGAFELKSGRISPYFFNAGRFCSGAVLAEVGRAYAAAVVASGVEFDVLFGPAYKGIPLATAVATFLALEHGRDAPVAYDRKEAKDHGEGGVLVGAPVAGKRVLLVDDVISAGTAVRHAIALLAAQGATPVGVVVGLDRQERAGGKEEERGGGGGGGGEEVEKKRAESSETGKREKSTKRTETDTRERGTDISETDTREERTEISETDTTPNLSKPPKSDPSTKTAPTTTPRILSAVQNIQRDFGIPVVAVATLRSLLQFVQRSAGTSAEWEERARRIREYRARYGVEVDGEEG